MRVGSVRSANYDVELSQLQRSSVRVRRCPATVVLRRSRQEASPVACRYDATTSLEARDGSHPTRCVGSDPACPPSPLEEQPCDRSNDAHLDPHDVIGVVAGSRSVAAACGSDSDESSTTDAPRRHRRRDAGRHRRPSTRATADTAASDTTATDEPAGDVPQRVVSLSPTHTEIMFAIGAGDQLVAVDDFSNYPAEALELPHELSGFEPNVEAIAAYEPDLVLIGGDFNGLGAAARRARHRRGGTARRR